MTNLNVFKSALNVFKYKPWQIIKRDIISSFRPLKYNVISQDPAHTAVFKILKKPMRKKYIFKLTYWIQIWGIYIGLRML